jgi:hypothetical protein
MSDRFLDGFGPDELALHNVVMQDRNEVTCRALRHSLGAVRRCSFTPLNLHRARVRRNRGPKPDKSISLPKPVVWLR